MSAPDVTEAQRGQGDLCRAIQLIIWNKLPFTEAGSAECEATMRENGEGHTAIWAHPSYLRNTIEVAQGLIDEIREGAS